MAATLETQPNYYITVGLPIFTLILGYCGSLFTEWKRDKRFEARERKTRRELRNQVIDDRRAAFQRETLLALSDILFELGEKVGQIVEYYRNNGVGALAINSTLSEEYMSIQRKVSKYRVRILDNDLRSLVDKTQRHASKLTFTKNKDEMDKEYNNCMDNRNNANEQLGKLLRELY
jgi:hypothetical protein